MSDTALTRLPRRYRAQKSFINVWSTKFWLYDEFGTLRFWCKQKPWRLREHIDIFAGNQSSQPQIVIRQGGIFDFSGGFAVTDGFSDEVVGKARRKGLVSTFIRDEWALHDAEGTEAGACLETGGLMIFLRRWVPWWPQKYEITWNGKVVGTIHQRLHLFLLQYDVDFRPSEGTDFDVRLGLAMTVLILAIESQRDSADD